MTAAIFRSLLYEACGRIVNPIYGSVGLLWSGSWQLCQAAVEAVLKGAPITPIASEAAANGHGPPLKAYDIRHVSKDENSAASNDHQRVKTRCRARRVVKPKPSKPELGSAAEPVRVEGNDREEEKRGKWSECYADQELMNRSTSHESSLSHQSEVAVVDGESKETESMVSVETAEASLLLRAETGNESGGVEDGVELELRLGLEPVARANHVVPMKKRRIEENTWNMGLGL